MKAIGALIRDPRELPHPCLRVKRQPPANQEAGPSRAWISDLQTPKLRNKCLQPSYDPSLRDSVGAVRWTRTHTRGNEAAALCRDGGSGEDSRILIS